MPKPPGLDTEEMVACELSDTEAKAYDRLKPPQGIHVPICYGRVRYNGQRALLLEHLGGSSLAALEDMPLELEQLTDLLGDIYRRLQTASVQQEDPRRGNFHVVTEHGRRRLKALDFERVSLDWPEYEMALMTTNHIETLLRLYRNRKKSFQGLLEPAE